MRMKCSESIGTGTLRTDRTDAEEPSGAIDKREGKNVSYPEGGTAK